MKKRSSLPLVALALAIGMVAAPPALGALQVGGVYLHRDGCMNVDPPKETTAATSDSGPVKLAGGNLWQLAGTWRNCGPAELFLPPQVDIWAGLKNSDDQGTRFDLMAVIKVNGETAGESTTYCVTGLTRNPAQAKLVEIGTGPIDPIAVTLEIYARIGTVGPGVDSCPGHRSATGVRLYYDSVNRASSVGGFGG